jgi:hypothetical protein
MFTTSAQGASLVYISGWPGGLSREKSRLPLTPGTGLRFPADRIEADPLQYPSLSRRASRARSLTGRRGSRPWRPPCRTGRGSSRPRPWRRVSYGAAIRTEWLCVLQYRTECKRKQMMEMLYISNLVVNLGSRLNSERFNKPRGFSP